MKIQILGTGCSKCSRLTEQAELAAKASGLPYELEKVTDLDKIMAYGVMSTPALVVDGKVVSSGRVPGAAEIAAFLKKA